MEHINIKIDNLSPNVDVFTHPQMTAKDSKDVASNLHKTKKLHIKKTEIPSLIKQVDEFVKKISTKVSFSVDNKTGKQIIIVSENETDKIIRQIPPKEMLALVAKMREMGGIIFSGMV